MAAVPIATLSPPSLPSDPDELVKGRRVLDNFGFRVKDLEGLVKELKKKGARFEVDLSEGGGGIKYAFLEGPEGIRIELVEEA